MAEINQLDDGYIWAVDGFGGTTDFVAGREAVIQCYAVGGIGSVAYLDQVQVLVKR